MNVVFHVLVGVVVSSFCASQVNTINRSKLKINSILVSGFLVSLFSHGLLDLLPHTYPFDGIIDLILAGAVFGISLLLIKPKYFGILTVCVSGSIVPDLIDLGPSLLNKFFSINLPVIKFFPWHWAKYSGSIYADSSKIWLSFLMHLLVLLVVFRSWCLKRRFIFEKMLRCEVKSKVI